MIAYHYNSLRFFDGETNCQKDPKASHALGHDVFLIPANATNIKPTIKEGYTPRWNGEKWEQYDNKKTVYGYTPNEDGTINYYGAAHTEEEVESRNKGVALFFSNTEPVSVDGVFWLSADNPDYIAAKKAADKAAAIASLTAEYTQEKANLCEAYTTASMQGDTETAQSVAADMADLDAWFDEEYQKIEGSAE